MVTLMLKYQKEKQLFVDSTRRYFSAQPVIYVASF